MIRYLKIRNFQSHIATKLSFGPGLNVIKGRSSSGKSSIIRALGWIFFNRPRGDSFRSWGCQKNAPIFAEVLFSTEDKRVSIRRQKKGVKNDYIVDGQVLGMVGSNVPDIVQDLSGINKVNFCSQHDGYFLITDSPGSVASAFGRLVGLQVLEKVRKVMSKKLTSIQSNIDVANNDLENWRSQWDALKWVPNAKKCSIKFEKVRERQLQLSSEVQRLKYIIGHHRELLDKYKRIQVPDRVPELINRLRNLIDDHKKVYNRFSMLNDLCNQLSDVQYELARKQVPVCVGGDISKLKSLLDSADQQKTSIMKLINYRQDLVSITLRAKESFDALGQKEEALAQFYKKINMCPYCERPF